MYWVNKCIINMKKRKEVEEREQRVFLLRQRQLEPVTLRYQLGWCGKVKLTQEYGGRRVIQDCIKQRQGNVKKQLPRGRMERFLLVSYSAKLGSLYLGSQSSHWHCMTDISCRTAMWATADQGVSQKQFRKHLNCLGMELQ